ncbi:MAG: hypothetical protein EP332_14475 [Bacteroidetes bacterium]|nr:MAG: hypothetical protein EP332_14475 [Bacteroidota bacterium]
MSDKLNITELERLLQEQLSQAEVPAPSGVWDSMADALNQLNSDLQFDHQVQEQLQEAQVEAPTEVWQAVQQSVAVQSGGLLSSIAAKWILGIGASAVLTASIFYFTDSGNSAETNQVTPQIESISESTSSLNKSEVAAERFGKPSPEESVSTEPIQVKPSHQGTVGNIIPVTRANPVSEAEGNLNSSSQQHAESGVNPTSVNHTGANRHGNARNVNPPKSTESLFMLMSFLSEDTSVCDGTRFEVQLLDGNFTELHVWLDGERVQTLQKLGSIQIPDLSPGTHSLRFLATSGENFSERKLQVRVHEKPKAELFVDEYGKGKFIFSMNMSSAMNYSWYLDGANVGTGNFWEYQFHDFEEQIHRLVLRMQNLNGCKDSVVKEVKNTSIIEIKEPKLYNLFTPNGDGYGDVFMLNVSGETYWKLTVYDSQKAKVFESTDSKQGWDGLNQFTGAVCGEGQYYCVLTYTLHGQKSRTEQWYLTLSR